MYRTAYARVSRGIVTDTELQIGQFVLPKHGFVLANQTEESRLLRSRKEDLPEYHVCLLCLVTYDQLITRQWFAMEYHGNEHEGGVNGHYYHVFNTVRTKSHPAEYPLSTFLAIILSTSRWRRVVE